MAVLDAGQAALPHSRSVRQQPPPSDAGQERNPEAQVSVAGGELVTVTVRVTVIITGATVEVLVVVEVRLVVVLVVVVEGTELVEIDGVIVV